MVLSRPWAALAIGPGKLTITELTAREKETWRKALLPLYSDLADRIGKDTIANFVKAAGGAPN